MRGKELPYDGCYLYSDMFTEKVLQNMYYFSYARRTCCQKPQHSAHLILETAHNGGYIILDVRLSGRLKLFLEFSKIVDGEFRQHCFTTFGVIYTSPCC